ncbi:hypothetical protein RF11_00444 [Thelohanellus kitauei]|uniref:Uncharacterized protein n=1 Tax=Thelohanellus kitauei TaxID=669202 RepID=A0A0C2JJG9_THEKT|nr:hypothetical protein RF11_00444 [Thelohanellus kitauei]
MYSSQHSQCLNVIQARTSKEWNKSATVTPLWQPTSSTKRKAIRSVEVPPARGIRCKILVDYIDVSNTFREYGHRDHRQIYRLPKRSRHGNQGHYISSRAMQRARLRRSERLLQRNEDRKSVSLFLFMLPPLTQPFDQTSPAPDLDGV